MSGCWLITRLDPAGAEGSEQVVERERREADGVGREHQQRTLGRQLAQGLDERRHVVLELPRLALGATPEVRRVDEDRVVPRAAAHLAAVLPSADWAHGLSTVELFEGMKPDPFTPEGGEITLPQATGWGVP